MKIYSKKAFLSGVFLLGLCAALFVSGLRSGFDTKHALLCTALLLFGTDSVRRSLSRRLSREDFIQEHDEREQLVRLRSRERSFSIARGASAVCLILTVLAWGAVGGEALLGAALAFALLFSVMCFAEMGAVLYYQKHL